MNYHPGEGFRMTTMELIVPLSVILLFLIFSFILLQGKGAILIAGYNTMSAKKKAKYDEAALCKATGKLLLTITLFIALITAADFFGMDWLVTISLVFMFVIISIALIYMNTGNRFKHAKKN